MRLILIDDDAYNSISNYALSSLLMHIYIQYYIDNFCCFPDAFVN